MDYFNLDANLHTTTSTTVGPNSHLSQILPPASEEAGSHLMGDTWVNPWGVITPPSPVDFTSNQTNSGEHCGHRLVDFGLTHGLQIRGSQPRTRPSSPATAKHRTNTPASTSQRFKQTLSQSACQTGMGL